jgi:hypothetical protein
MPRTLVVAGKLSSDVSAATALLLSKMNLAGWLHPHFVFTCPEAIQRLVIERDNLLTDALSKPLAALRTA